MKITTKKIGIILVFMLYVITNSNRLSAADESMLVLSNTNTTCNVYAKADGKEVITYINPLYQRDVPMLSKSGSYYKIVVSGVEGWIKSGERCFNGSGATVKKVSQIPSFSFTTGTKKLSGLDVSRYQVDGSKLYFGLVYGSYITYNIGYTDVPKGLVDGKVYYSYDGVYYYLSYNTMVADYRAKTRKNAANYSSPYYDYYQYVPLRTVSKVSATALDKRLLQKQSDASKSYKETKTFNQSCSSSKYFTSNYNYYVSAVYKKGSIFTSKQSAYQVNAGVLYGIMLNESANGTSNLSRHYNNPFGWGAYDSCPNSATRYSSMDTAIASYYSNMSSSYANPAASTGGMGTHLGNKKAGANVKYASDPHWGYKNAYNYRIIDELAGKVDKNRYKLGLVNSGSNAVDGYVKNEITKVYTSASTSSSSPYFYERNNSTVVILGESGSFYKIQKDSSANSGYVYILKSKVKLINTPVSTTPTPAPSPSTSELSKLNYEKVGTSHYIWGKNNYGQLGNNSTVAKAKTSKINVASLIPSGETIKQVLLYNNTNIYVLTNSGNVYSSGSNYYGQRSYTSKSNVFTKTNPFNDKIYAIAISDNRLRMQRLNNKAEYYYVGNNGFNFTTQKFTRKTSYPVLVKYVNNKPQYSKAYNYSLQKVSDVYNYSSGYLYTSYSYSYDSKKNINKLTYKKYSKGVITYTKILTYLNKVTTFKWEYYYVNGKLKSTSKAKAARYGTYYKAGKANETYRRYYSTTGKLGSSIKITVRK